MKKERLASHLSQYAPRMLEILKETANPSARTYGFEYEFISRNPMTPEHVREVGLFLEHMGFSRTDAGLYAPEGVNVGFEPGGQLEYSSIPLQAPDDERLGRILRFIESVNEAILENVGVEYLAADSMPHRGNAPLCLTAQRYLDLHARMPGCGTLGRRMMKGTASIHLHLTLCSLREIPAIFKKLVELSLTDEFRMSAERRRIWDNTDPCRCGLPFHAPANFNSGRELVNAYVLFALEAEELGSGIPFWHRPRPDWEAFAGHMTTIFTDVRFNMKGPTLELRTLGSLPVPEFRRTWRLFVEFFENPDSWTPAA